MKTAMKTWTSWIFCHVFGFHVGRPQDQFLITYKCIHCGHEWERW